jgi:hypothetical protein
MPNTPDRFPGPLQESEEILLTEQAPGTIPTAAGGILYADGQFKLEDAAGVFDPRGITEAQHEVLDTLIHGLSETCFQEVVRTAGRVTSVVFWTDAGKTVRVREVLIIRAAGKVSQLDVVHYTAAGAEKQRMTGVFTRDGNGKVASIDWTETVA